MKPRAPSRQHRPARRGVSLIEALVALAVMAFGMLGLAGLQTSLRVNADQARQRSEAVRIAAATLENQRSFSVLGTEVGRRAFDDIVATSTPNVVAADANTSFSREFLVESLPADADRLTLAEHKRVVTNVTWVDRSNTQQRVSFASIVAAQAPEAALAIMAAADATAAQQFSTRNAAIPYNAVDQGNGTSKFSPPGSVPGLNWVFSNTTGYITQLCLGAICIDYPARLLTGFVRFSTGLVQPTGANAETPPSAVLQNGAGARPTVYVAVTAPVAGNFGCYHSYETTWIEYFCAVPAPAPTLSWSGRALVSLPNGLDLAGSLDDDHDDRYRVCRYTVPAARVIPHVVVPTIRNEDHPLDYLTAKNSLTNQNFLVIRAGDDHDPFVCPADDATTPLVNGTTWHHQPATN